MSGVPEFSFSSMIIFDSESSMANWYTQGSGSLKGCCFSSSSNILSKVRSNILRKRRRERKEMIIMLLRLLIFSDLLTKHFQIYINHVLNKCLDVCVF